MVSPLDDKNLNLPSMEEYLELLKDNPEVVRGAVAAADGRRMGWTPWQHSLEPRGKPARRRFPVQQQALPDPAKRSQMERVNSLTNKLVQHYRKHGTLGLSGKIINQLIGETWKAGHPMTGDQIKAIAGAILKRAADKAPPPGERERIVAPNLNRSQRRQLARQTKAEVVKA